MLRTALRRPRRRPRAPEPVLASPTTHVLALLPPHVRQGSSRATSTLVPRVPRALSSGVLPVPNPRDDPNAWFAAVDADGDGKLSPSEVVEVLARSSRATGEPSGAGSAPTSSDVGTPTAMGSSSVGRWSDPEVSSTSSAATSPATPPPAPRLPPSPRAGRVVSTLDEDRSGTLDKDEVTRALLKTFRLRDDLRQVREIRGVVDAVWSLFDADGDGRVDRNEFLARDGLAETIVASVGREMSGDESI